MMRTVIEGHLYALKTLGGREVTLQFVSKSPHEIADGVLNQEVLRCLIDRVKFLDAEKPWKCNADILYHLRMAIVLHENRALERDVEKGELLPEFVRIDNDGHFYREHE